MRGMVHLRHANAERILEWLPRDLNELRIVLCVRHRSALGSNDGEGRL